jgi:hypothetical protein
MRDTSAIGWHSGLIASSPLGTFMGSWPSFLTTRMSCTRKLTPPIQLKDDRTLETLADVRKLMLSLPESRLRNGHWVCAGQLLMAAATHKGVSLHDVQQQLSIALKAEELI